MDFACEARFGYTSSLWVHNLVFTLVWIAFKELTPYFLWNDQFSGSKVLDYELKHFQGWKKKGLGRNKENGQEQGKWV